jgi:hypothetical protein
MALVLDATLGGPAANTYCTLAEALAYHESHVYASTWTESGNAQRGAALAMATRLIDVHMEFEGVVVTSTQALAWPRLNVLGPNGYPVDNTIPALVRDATAEFARQLLGKDRTKDLAQAGLKRLKAGPVELEFDGAFSAQVLPDSVFDMLRPYGRKKAGRRVSVPLVRV